eukprot:jgi/Bigna1/84853/estExt_fgenesh1_pg.C_10214
MGFPMIDGEKDSLYDRSGQSASEHKGRSGRMRRNRRILPFRPTSGIYKEMSSGAPRRLKEDPLSLTKTMKDYTDCRVSKCASNSNGISIFKRTISPTFNGNTICNSVTIAKPQTMRARSPLYLFSTLNTPKSTGFQVIRPRASYPKSCYRAPRNGPLNTAFLQR